MATEVQKGEKEGALRPAQGQLVSPFERMERLFDEIFPRRWMRPFHRAWPSRFDFAFESPFEGRVPKVDIIDREDEIVLRAELPGVKKDDLDVTLSEHPITLHAKTARDETEEQGEYYRREMASGEFQRTIGLPENVNSAKAKAKFADGILDLTIPKTETTKRHKIQVQ